MHGEIQIEITLDQARILMFGAATAAAGAGSLVLHNHPPIMHF